MFGRTPVPTAQRIRELQGLNPCKKGNYGISGGNTFEVFGRKTKIALASTAAAITITLAVSSTNTYAKLMATSKAKSKFPCI